MTHIYNITLVENTGTPKTETTSWKNTFAVVYAVKSGTARNIGQEEKASIMHNIPTFPSLVFLVKFL